MHISKADWPGDISSYAGSRSPKDMVKLAEAVAANVIRQLIHSQPSREDDTCSS